MNDPATQRKGLIELSHELGAEHRQLAILGEGNTSARVGEETFIVKASGSSLGTLRDEHVVECRFAPLLELLEKPAVSDEEIDATLFACRVDSAARKPSVEALFHADLLSLPNVNFVGHTHPIAINSILCSPLAEKFAAGRLFPDEIVCCGGSSVLVPYTDPGLKLAQFIHQATRAFLQTHGVPPRVILLRNHGIITLGSSAAAVQAAMFMAVKAAAIFLGAAALGGPIFLSDADVDRIANRKDEHHRQKALGL
ncbi:MAG TPA: class II aldolase/adducin family protein [Chthoniobacteraceae bacterium]